MQTIKKFKKGDTVLVTAGRDKGMKGEIIRLLPKADKLVVKGVALYKRHVKPTQSKEGGVISVERPIATAKVALLVGDKPTRVGLKRNQDGVKRVAKKTGSEL
jgi:large subunit ribosomal protein L24